ncbi:MAG TPA: dienelactone hydrolase family protein [Candidatus Limnocylindrales bacterium]|jgi:carboxymethylenebutenolidase|nr:dienelactone hydrolase family protein [Candidatus Limnocylindrales bacterium]
MCFSADARPPLPPIRGAAVDAGDLILTSRDGTRIPAYAARAEQPSGAGIVIVPDVRGLHPYYEELALRFAEAGVDAVTLDLYARTAGTSKRDEGFDPQPHVLQLDPARVDDDVAAAWSHLRSHHRDAPTRVYTVGFCLGGRVSLLQAAAGLGLAGVIGFYPWPVGEHRSGLPAPADEAPRFACPVLALYGGADPGIPAEARDAFDLALDEAGVRHRSVTYPDAPHSFFDRKAEEHGDASADAWRQVLDFMEVVRT